MIHFIAGMILLYCATSYAFETCVSHCLDRKGEVIIETSCAAPGGNMTTTTQYFQDECNDNILKDYSCVRGPEGDHVLTEERKVNCSEREI